MGVTRLGRMVGADPNLALSVQHGLGRWEAGRSVGGMDPECKGWMTVHDRAGTSSSNTTTTTTCKGKEPPPQGPQEETPLRE